MNKLIPLFLLLMTLSFVDAQAASDFLFNKGHEAEISVNNRVLAHVNGKAITVVDVMKKMDIHFLKQFPEYTSSPQARFQYYQVNFRQVLQELIDKELILADATENKVPLPAGDVRQEMESLFGPNIIFNLDKIGLTFDEAFKIVQGDLLLRKMMMIRVNAKAVRQVTPQVIREAYEEYAAKNMKKETFHYQVVSIRNSDETLGAETANEALRLLTEQAVPLAEIVKAVKEVKPHTKSTINVSDPLFHTEQEMADAIRETVKAMDDGSYSKVLAQKSRQDRGTVFRILFLKEKVPAGQVPYSEIENQIKEKLFDEVIVKESDAYLKKLRAHHAIHDSYLQDMVPEDFEPFTLK